MRCVVQFIILLVCIVYAILAKVFMDTPKLAIVDKSGGAERQRKKPDHLSAGFLTRQKEIESVLHPTSQILSTWHALLTDYIITSRYKYPFVFFRLLWESLGITEQTFENNRVITHMNDLPRTPPYMPGTGLAKFGIHIGQRKLFLNELYFIIRRIPIEEKAVVIYAGAAPAHKGALLAAMTPNITWVFIDPAEFNIKQTGFEHVSIKTVYPLHGFDIPSVKQLTKVQAVRCAREIYKNPARINIINAYMSTLIAGAFHILYGQNTLYFISDIRTNMYADSARNRYPDTADITLNNVWQYNWLRIIRPKYAMLKFRPPFYAEREINLEKCIQENEDDFILGQDGFCGMRGIKFAENARAKKMVYFSGEIVLQPWAPITSTEVRLETTCKETREYDGAEHDTQMFLYNTIYRNIKFMPNPNADPSIGFDHCNDCAFENIIWTEWLKLYGPFITKYSDGAFIPPDTVKKCVEMLTMMIGDRSLIFKDERMPNFIYHGDMHKKIGLEHFIKMLDYHRATYDKFSVQPDTYRRLNANDDD